MAARQDAGAGDHQCGRASSARAVRGIHAAKRLKDAGLAFDCFEMSDDVGGNWYYRNPNGRSACYQSLHIDTSKWRLAFEDYPSPPHGRTSPAMRNCSSTSATMTITQPARPHHLRHRGDPRRAASGRRMGRHALHRGDARLRPAVRVQRTP
ncbi:hypothetical protein AB5I41_12710 [Sphingomonas sp. MMS24-JH45]